MPGYLYITNVYHHAPNLPSHRCPLPPPPPELLHHQPYRAGAGTFCHHGAHGHAIPVPDDQCAVPKQGADVLCQAELSEWYGRYTDSFSPVVRNAEILSRRRGRYPYAKLALPLAKGRRPGVPGLD